MDLMIGMVIGAMLFILYFVPALVAKSRDHQSLAPIAIVNLFFGWTFIGWVVCLAWASSKVSKEHLKDLGYKI